MGNKEQGGPPGAESLTSVCGAEGPTPYHPGATPQGTESPRIARGSSCYGPPLMRQAGSRIKAREHLALIGRAIGLVWAGGKSWTVLSLALLLVQGLLPLASLYLLKVVLDSVEHALASPGPTVTSDVMRPVAFLAGVAALSTLVRAFAGWAGQGQSLAVTDHVQRALHARSVTVDLEYYETSRYYDTLHRAQQEGAFRPTMIANGVVQLLQNTISLVGVVVLIVAFDVRVALVLLLAALPGLMVKLGFSNRLYALRRRRTETERKAGYLHWVLTSDRHAREVRLFDLGHELIRRFGEIRLILRRERMSLAARALLADVATQLLAVAAMFAALAYAIHLTLAGALTIGAMVMY
ncbi:MAG: ABC transporter transmembrane domain-containing protein, partial [Polyangiaceae bacterium]|nr:ABC transporter transmembrane domain-containing protein [Polyangiaceae bacterium]